VELAAAPHPMSHRPKLFKHPWEAVLRHQLPQLHLRVVCFVHLSFFDLNNVGWKKSKKKRMST
jgi:hypothetical protein